MTSYEMKHDKMRGVFILYSVVSKKGRIFRNFVAEGSLEVIQNIKERMEKN